MSVSDSFRTLVVDQLSRAVRGLRTRRMFGGVGLYGDDLFFALIAEDALYFKTDASTRPDFVARGMEPFRPYGEDAAPMSYYQLPEDVLEDEDLLREWAEKAIAVARRASATKARRRPR